MQITKIKDMRDVKEPSRQTTDDSGFDGLSAITTEINMVSVSTWGLIALQEAVPGQFIDEYLGELCYMHQVGV